VDGSLLALFLLAEVAALVDWWAVQKERKPVEYAAKPAVMVFLIAAALTLDPADEARRNWFVVALVFSLAGDVFLMLPGRFVPGLAAFLVAHLAYIAGFHFRPEPLPELYLFEETSMWGLAAAGAFFGIVTFSIGRRVVAGAARVNAKLPLPVTLYMIAITVMVAKATSDGHLLAAGAALLFYVSDALIGFRRFVRAASWMPLAIMVTYHLAQFGFVASLLR
jgi:uncharacterized membrane protein YhhN